ncbi:hypothetical protein ABL78_0469 [Leptomonas seymouri]|uniref:Uncharacterized protein n=1 Tax=Leptomonas seymouri TaxID=5684 RepID=A0A0N1PDI8_LEPSE|nr:hypothetical protein ABL78_0469 [Leptomonas seymouri]|eukprot:KPI90393.1 hypothetical protein ABL78_0469 [Leptomonas seymouri]
MPPKRGRVLAGQRNDETQRLPGNERVKEPTTTTGVLDRRPHHLVSRLHPPWNTPGKTNSPSGYGRSGGHHSPVHAGGAGATAVEGSAAPTAAAKKVAVNTRGRGALATRVTSRNGVAARGERESSVSSSTAHAPVVGKRNAATAAFGQKRSRSLSTSNPIEVEVDADASAEEEDDNASGPSRKGMSAETSSQTSSASPSPLPMVAVSKVLHAGTGSSGNSSAAQMMSAAGRDCSAPPETHSTSCQDRVTVATAVNAASTAKVAAKPVSPRMLPPRNTATSTADSKVLFGDDDDDGDLNDGCVWSTHGGVVARNAAAPDSVSPLPDRTQGARVLGELPDRASATPACPTSATVAVAAVATHGSSGKAAPQRVIDFLADGVEEDEEGELLGEAAHSTVAAARAAHPVAKPMKVMQQIIGEETENQTASTGPATPSLLPTHDRVSLLQYDRSPGTDAVALPASTAAAHFAETLAVHDLSFLPEDSENANTEVEVSPILPSSTELHTPCVGLAVDAADANRAATCADEEAKQRRMDEELLGEGLVSPLAKRVTATPQQAAQGTAAAVASRPGSHAMENEERSDGNAAAIKCELHPPPPFLNCVSAASTTDSSLLTPQTPPRASAAPDAHGQTTAVLQPSSSASPLVGSPATPPHVSSLPSTVDDGCWKDDEQTPLRTPPSSFLDAVSKRHEKVAFSRSLSMTAVAAAAAPVEAASALQETVPIDPFLSTPPQLRKSGAARHSAVLSEESEATTERVMMASSAGKKGEHSSSRSPQRRATERGKRRRSASKSPTPPRVGGARHQMATDVDQLSSNAATTTTCIATDMDPALLRVGTRVEGRWGRQWFPAVVSEAPRNGFVQIEWVEDASLLHVRLREVRLPPGAPGTPLPETTSSTTNGEESCGTTAGKKAVSAIPSQSRGREGNEAVLTATQLVELMEEEDAADNRHEVGHCGPARASANPASIKGKKPPSTLAECRVGKEGDDVIETEAAENDDSLGHEATPQSCNRRKNSTPPLTTSTSISSPPATPPLRTPHGEASTSTAAEVNLLEQESLVLPFETTPSALCIYLAPSVRRELLRDTCSPIGGVVDSRELQRSTELQRILHYLASAGATLISSLAQADNVAAQLGDKESASNLFQRPTTTAAERRSTLTSCGSGGNSSAAVGRRKTVGRVPLARRSGLGSPFTAAAPARKFFIFLVSPESSSLSSLATETGGRAPLHHLPDVCVAHAFGVSAIHASWLWSVVPGALHVRLPTAMDQLELPAGFLSSLGKESMLNASSPKDEARTALPLRLTPFSSHQRWLSGKAIQFAERDDAMETWLNATGAVVTAEPPPPPPLSPGTIGIGNASALAQVDLSAAAATGTPHRRSVSLTRQQRQSPPRRPQCAEKRPDLVYLRESDITAPVDLNRLGDVPVLRLPWLVKGIELNYRARCGDGGGQHVVENSEEGELEAPPLLASVWEEMQKAVRATAASATRSPSRKERSTTPTLKESALESPSVAPSAREQHPRAVARRKTVADSAVEAPMAERTVAAESGKPAESVNLPVAGTSASDGSAQQFLTPRPGTKTPVSHRSVVALQAPVVSSATLPLNGLPVTEAEATQETKHGSGGGAIPRTGEENEEQPRIESSEAETQANPATPLLSATSQRPLQQPFCTHPPIAIGEDYYFSIAAPSASPINAASTLLATVPTTTVVLGRVVALYPNVQHESFASGPPHSSVRGAVVSGPSSTATFVDMQLYKAKYVSMHIDPRSGQVVHETTVYLSPQRTTIPASSLLFDIPVYVITAAARQHVYLLEDQDEESAPSAAPPVCRYDVQQRQVHEGFAERNCDISTRSPQRNQSTTVSASPAPASPIPRRQAGQQFGGGQQDDSHNDELMETAQRWTVNASDPMQPSPSRGGVASQQKYDERYVDRCNASNEANGLLPKGVCGATNNSSVNVASSIPRTLEVTELEERLPHSGVVARHAVQGLREVSSQRLSSPRSAPPAIRLLTELPLEIGGQRVVLRPESNVRFYAGRSLSLPEPSPFTPARLSSPTHREDSPSDFPLNSDEAQNKLWRGRTAGFHAHHHSHSGHESDSSEELIAEAPLVGKVELIRKIDGMVDIVLHTAQPNSVFGGSKMYRVTPDMIVDAFP